MWCRSIALYVFFDDLNRDRIVQRDKKLPRVSHGNFTAGIFLILIWRKKKRKRGRGAKSLFYRADVYYVIIECPVAEKEREKKKEISFAGLLFVRKSFSFISLGRAANLWLIRFHVISAIRGTIREPLSGATLQLRKLTVFFFVYLQSRVCKRQRNQVIEISL